MGPTLQAYLECALWASTDSVGETFDGYDFNDFASGEIERARTDVMRFQVAAGSLLDNLDPEMVGHDIWLTRNRHGVGFWDREYPKAVGDALTEIAKSLGEAYVYVDDDGKFRFS